MSAYKAAARAACISVKKKKNPTLVHYERMLRTKTRSERKELSRGGYIEAKAHYSHTAKGMQNPGKIPGYPFKDIETSSISAIASSLFPTS